MGGCVRVAVVEASPGVAAEETPVTSMAVVPSPCGTQIEQRGAGDAATGSASFSNSTDSADDQPATSRVVAEAAWPPQSLQTAPETWTPPKPEDPLMATALGHGPLRLRGEHEHSTAPRVGGAQLSWLSSGRG